MTQKIQTLRGIRDLVDAEFETYRKIVEIGSRIAEMHNYKPILLPIFEYSSVFFRTLGETSDIVTKETYTFSDREKRMLTLRPEFTASIVRALISNGLTQSMPQRFFTYGPLFRHERPQLGRYRQFYQFDCELFGSSSPCADVEVINILLLILRELKVDKHIQIEINSLGDSESINKYQDALKQYLLKYENDLSEISKKRLLTNPLRILDTKEEQDLLIIADAPLISHYFNYASAEHYAAVCEGLELLNINFKMNNKLVRGLDYYTHTVFEITTNKLGSQNAIVAGGRYNDLVEMMGGGSIPAVGFAIGIDRIHELLKQDDLLSYDIKAMCYLVPIGPAAQQHAISIASELRNQGIIVCLDYDLTIKKRLKIADREKAQLCIIFGDDELENNEYKIRYMSDSTEVKIHSEELYDTIFQYLNKK